jgi:hypothetical protein
MAALSGMPDETVIDGEVVALDPSGRPSFHLLQNYGCGKTPVIYYVFDLMMLSCKNLTGETLESRRALLEGEVFPKLAEPIRYSPLAARQCGRPRAIGEGTTGRLLDPGVFRLGLLEDWDVGVGIFPKAKEILVGSLCPELISRQSERSA